jgi:hypothetical protein
MAAPAVIPMTTISQSIVLLLPPWPVLGSLVVPMTLPVRVGPVWLDSTVFTAVVVRPGVFVDVWVTSSVAVRVGVCVRTSLVFVAVPVAGVFVGVGVLVLVDVFVAVGVLVLVGVLVGVCVLISVVFVGVGVFVGVFVGVLVLVGVFVGVCVSVAVFVAVFVGVLVFVGTLVDVLVGVAVSVSGVFVPLSSVRVECGVRVVVTVVSAVIVAIGVPCAQ